MHGPRRGGATRPGPGGPFMLQKRAQKIDKVIGRNIRIHRLSRKMSQTELGDQLGVSFQQVQKYENGTNRVGSGRLYQIAAILGLHVSNFFKGGETADKAGDSGLLDLLTEPQRVGRSVRSALEDPLNDVMVSSASAWEMAIKASIGRLRAPDDLEAELLREGIGSIDITMSDARAAGALPPHHSDPFDRMLIAQAQRRRMTVVTRDALFAAYDVAVLAP